MFAVLKELLQQTAATMAADLFALQEAAGFGEHFFAANQLLNHIVWGLPCCLLILTVGIWLSCGCGFLQFRRSGYILKNTLGKALQRQSATAKGAVSPFEAMSTALAATVGTGNIAGVAGAISIGGPGAVFWMWVSALFGMATKYAEIVLAVKYRERSRTGEWVGGPMYYISRGLGPRWNWLATLFAVFATLASFGIGNMTQVNSIVTAVEALQTSFGASSDGNLPLIIGIILMLLTALILRGGAKRIGKTAGVLVPFMAALYIIGGLAVLLFNINNLFPTLRMIVSNAFGIEAMIGGSSGYIIASSIRMGFARGCFSNEAGLGSAPIAHAGADTPGPVQQGFYGVFEVFADTIVICTLTALIILLPGMEIGYGSRAGAELTMAGLATVFGERAAAAFMAAALGCFAFSTLLGWAVYGSRSFAYLFGERAVKYYYLIFILAIMAGATMELDVVWSIADTLNGLMALPNIIAVALLSPQVFRLTKEYFAAHKKE